MTTSVPDNACIVQRMMIVIRATISLQSELLACMSRLTVLDTTLQHEDVANCVDRLNEVFNAYSFLTRCNGWHGLDEDDSG